MNRCSRNHGFEAVGRRGGRVPIPSSASSNESSRTGAPRLLNGGGRQLYSPDAPATNGRRDDAIAHGSRELEHAPLVWQVHFVAADTGNQTIPRRSQHLNDFVLSIVVLDYDNGPAKRR